MGFLIVGALIGIISVFIGILFVYLIENQKKKARLQQIITRALMELNENKDLLGQILTYLKQVHELLEPLELDKKYETLVESNASIFKSDELNQLKMAAEFMNFADIKTNIDVNNVIIRLRYANKFFAQNKKTADFSNEEYKTLHHTHEMVESLIETLSGELAKIKG